MMILFVLVAFVFGAWGLCELRAGHLKGRVIPAVLVATGAFLLWWVPMLFLELQGGIDSHPEFDIPIHRAALIAVIFAIASLLVAGKNPMKNTWITTARIVASVTIFLGIITVLFSAP